MTTSEPLPSRVLIFSVTVVTILGNSLIVSSVPDMLRDLGVDESAAGFVVASASVPGIVVAPAMGFLADRYGRRRILVPCLWGFGLAGASVGLSPSFEMLIVLRLAQGLFSGGLINLVVVVIADHWTGNERAKLIGYNAATITVCVALYPVLGGAITDLFGWRWMFVTYLAAPLVGIAVARSLRELPRQAKPMGPQVRRAGRLVAEMPYRVVFPFQILAFAIVFGLFLATMPVHLDEQFGLGPTQRGLVAAVPAVTATLAALLVGRTRDRVSQRSIVGAGFGVFALAFVAMGLGPLWVIVVATAAYGAAEGTALPTLQDIVAEQAPEDVRGAMIALFVGAARLGQVIGPLFVSWALLNMESGSVFLVAALLPGIATLALAARPSWLASRPGPGATNPVR